MTCAFLIALVDLAFPLVSRTAMYTWLPEKQFRVFFIVMAAVVVTYAVRSGLYFVVAYWGHTFGIRVEADIRAALFGHMQELGFEFFDRNRTGQLMSRMRPTSLRSPSLPTTGRRICSSRWSPWSAPSSFCAPSTSR